MSLNYANYETRQGVQPISWQDFHSICRGLALAASNFDPQVILGITRGGLYAGTLISHLLRKDFYAIYLTRRRLDQKVSEQPQWLVSPPELVRGQRVLVVDEISGSGETLRMAKKELARLGAAEVQCAVMYAHSWGIEVPDYIGLVSDALLINPWDREIIQDGQVIFHPEYVYALGLQKVPPDQVLPMPGVTTHLPEKRPSTNGDNE
jgi:hypoxanthine phosphoribosyltransferase